MFDLGIHSKWHRTLLEPSWALLHHLHPETLTNPTKKILKAIVIFPVVHPLWYKLFWGWKCAVWSLIQIRSSFCIKQQCKRNMYNSIRYQVSSRYDQIDHFFSMHKWQKQNTEQTIHLYFVIIHQILKKHLHWIQIGPEMCIPWDRFEAFVFKMYKTENDPVRFDVKHEPNKSYLTQFLQNGRVDSLESNLIQIRSRLNNLSDVSIPSECVM